MNTKRASLARVSSGRFFQSSMFSILLLAAACSSGQLDENSDPNVSPAGTAEAGSGSPSEQSAPRETSQGTGLTMSGDAEILTNLTFPDGSEIAFIRVGGGFLVSELVDASSVARTKGLSAELTPVERFKRLAPELQVPERLSDAQSRLGWKGVRTEIRGVGNDVRVQQTPVEGAVQQQRSEAGEPLHGLQAFDNCDAGTFVDDACGDVGNQDVHWQQINQNANAFKDRSDVWRGQTNVCAKTGKMFVRLVIENTDIEVVREITAGQADLRQWQMGETCPDSGWCWPFCFPDYCFRNGADVVHAVYQVSSADRFHWCGFYEYP